MTKYDGTGRPIHGGGRTYGYIEIEENNKCISYLRTYYLQYTYSPLLHVKQHPYNFQY